MSTKQTQAPIAVRLPPELQDYIKRQAALNFRSASSEIAMRVERTRQADLQSSNTLKENP